MTRPARYHLTQLTSEAAERHDRNAYHVEPHVRLGWIPYTYRLTRDMCALSACHTETECRAMLARYGLAEPEWSAWDNGVRTAWPVEVAR